MVNVERAWTKRTQWMIAAGYVACWVVGLLIGGPDLLPNADDAEVTQAFSGSLALLAFAVLVHGLAAVLLLALGWSLASGRTARAAIVLASVAAALSVVQLVGEVAMIAAPDGLPAAMVWDFITRADGIKMLVLAGLIAAVHGGRFAKRVVLTIVSAAAALALLISGLGYLALIPELMTAANVSLPLLLVWALVATAARVSETRTRTAGEVV